MIVPLLMLGGGLAMLNVASKRKKPRSLKARAGEACEPDERAPHGYRCGKVNGEYELIPEKAQFFGYGPYPSRAAVDRALGDLGFPGGNIAAFQNYMSNISKWDLRRDGAIDRDTILALRHAHELLERGEWIASGGHS